MSSSRSIAAARNRRSGDSQPQQQQQQMNRPGTSIASQSALQGGNRRMPQPQQQQQQQQPSSSQHKMSQSQSQQEQPQRIKLSVSDAIGLITLRLGRVEQILIDQEGAAARELRVPDGTQLVDKSVFSSIINRLEVAETKGNAITSYEDIIQRLEKELKDLKDSLLKHEASVKKSFEDVDAAFVDLESQCQCQVEETPLIDANDDGTVSVSVIDVTEFTVNADLKSLVQQDLIGI